MRRRAFRDIDYKPDNSNELRQFDSFDDAFAFDEAQLAAGSGGRKAKYHDKPKDVVPEEQRALEAAITHVAQEVGNEIVAEIDDHVEGIHLRFDKVGKHVRSAAAALENVMHEHAATQRDKHAELLLRHDVLEDKVDKLLSLQRVPPGKKSSETTLNRWALAYCDVEESSDFIELLNGRVALRDGAEPGGYRPCSLLLVKKLVEEPDVYLCQFPDGTHTVKKISACFKFFNKVRINENMKIPARLAKLCGSEGDIMDEPANLHEAARAKAIGVWFKNEHGEGTVPIPARLLEFLKPSMSEIVAAKPLQVELREARPGSKRWKRTQLEVKRPHQISAEDIDGQMPVKKMKRNDADDGHGCQFVGSGAKTPVTDNESIRLVSILEEWPVGLIQCIVPLLDEWSVNLNNRILGPTTKQIKQVFQDIPACAKRFAAIGEWEEILDTEEEVSLEKLAEVVGLIRMLVSKVLAFHESQSGTTASSAAFTASPEPSVELSNNDSELFDAMEEGESAAVSPESSMARHDDELDLFDAMEEEEERRRGALLCATSSD